MFCSLKGFNFNIFQKLRPEIAKNDGLDCVLGLSLMCDEDFIHCLQLCIYVQYYSSMMQNIFSGIQFEILWFNKYIRKPGFQHSVGFLTQLEKSDFQRRLFEVYLIYINLAKSVTD